MASLKSPIKSWNLWTGIATIVAAVFSYFALSPDPAAAQALSDEAHRAAEAISTKNYILLATIVFNIGNILYHLFKKS